MEKFRGKRIVQGRDGLTAKFPIEFCISTVYDADGYFQQLHIVDGEILKTWNSRSKSEKKIGDPCFVKSCYSTIRFIADHKPKELEDIYNVLKSGEMKDLCKLLKREKMVEKFDL